MPRYHFIIHERIQFEDDSGTFLPDEIAAAAYAKRVIRELKVTDNFDNAEWMMTVKDAAGCELLTIRFKDIP